MKETRLIFAGTAAILLLLALLSVFIYRATDREVVAAFSEQQLAVARTLAVAVETDGHSLARSVRQLSTLPSVQNLDIEFIGQRVRAAFEPDADGFIVQVVRIDARQRRYAWSLHGDRVATAAAGLSDQHVWAWFADRANAGQVRLGPVWWDAAAPAHHRVLATPVWRVASSGPIPVPPNDFNGLLAFVIDTRRLLQIYARPAQIETTERTFWLLLSDRTRVRLGADPRLSDMPVPPESQAEGVETGSGYLWAWSRLKVAGDRWVVMLGSPYSLAAARVSDVGLRQLGIVAVLLVLVPVVAWMLVRREREKEEERRVLEAQLAQSQKMDAIGKLAGGVAHDFNNMLTAILGFVGLILEDAPAGSPVHKEATHIKRAAESAAALTQKLLAFSRRQVLQPEKVDLGQLVKDTLIFLKRLLGEHIRIASELDADIWPVIADPVQVEQALINLAVNARDAMPNGGRLEITLRNAPLPHGENRPHHDVDPGDYVQIVVRDTGVGMDEATRARMFEPFFTTKPKGKGTGLGLSSVWGFVKQSGGHINVKSVPNAGTTIELLLPRAEPEVTERRKSGPRPAVQGRETILLVEDEPAVREFARTTLERFGFNVLAANGPEEALRIAKDFRSNIALLLTDVVMPNMQGPELAEEVRRMRPDVRVLFMSGYAADSMTHATLKDAALLHKPFPPAVLTRAVRLVLDRTA
jgi:signal transduction histidine kinase/CheY-like chemotaxis protein